MRSSLIKALPLLLTIVSVLPTASTTRQVQRHAKLFAHSLTLTASCVCEETGEMCVWLLNHQPLPPGWLDTVSGRVWLPPNDWSVYGNYTSWCGNTLQQEYDVYNLGEQCSDCLTLQYSNAIVSVGARISLWASTNLSYHHDRAISLLVNDSVQAMGNDAPLRCTPEGSPFNSMVRYSCTAQLAGTAVVQAHTMYYGAEWYSPKHTIVIVSRCPEDGSSAECVAPTMASSIMPETASDVSSLSTQMTSWPTSTPLPPPMRDTNTTIGGNTTVHCEDSDIDCLEKKEVQGLLWIMSHITIIVVVIVPLALVALLFICCWCYCRRAEHGSKQNPIDADRERNWKYPAGVVTVKENFHATNGANWEAGEESISDVPVGSSGINESPV